MGKIKSYSQFVSKLNHLGKAYNFGAGKRPQSGNSLDKKIINNVIGWVKRKLKDRRKAKERTAKAAAKVAKKDKNKYYRSDHRTRPPKKRK